MGSSARYAPTLNKILKSIIYVSCSQVSARQTRSLQRVKTLIELLDTNSQFCECLLRHVAKLQADREASLSSDEVARSWLFKEAAKVSHVVKYGTLKSSCISFIEHRLGHLLAGLIAFVDTNSNLNLLVRPSREWIPRLWLQMFLPFSWMLKQFLDQLVLIKVKEVEHLDL